MQASLSDLLAELRSDSCTDATALALLSDGLKTHGAIWLEGELLSQFFADRCAPDRQGYERTESVYGAYKDWCEANGVAAWSKPTLTRRLKEWRGIMVVTKRLADSSKTKRCYVGMRLLGSPPAKSS